MPPHLRPIPQPKCTESQCTLKATYMLYNSYNAEMAPYCTKHGEKRLAQELASWNASVSKR